MWLSLVVLACSAGTWQASAFDRIEVRADGIDGGYEGPEVISAADAARLGVRDDDYAHQFSNRVVRVVGDELKARAAAGKPSRVKLEEIHMTTEGLNGRGDVIYTLWIPLETADTPRARLHFEHRGGWGHASEFVDAWTATLRTKFGTRAECTPALHTLEGLEETWCQW